MFKKMLNFINEIRNAEENIKRRWLIIFSGITMTVVISLWVGYFNLTLPRVAPPSGMAVTEEEIQQNESQLTHITKTLAAGFSVFMEKINTKKSLIIKAPERNFIPENSEEIPTTQLP